MRDETLLPGVELLESMRSVGYSLNAAVADIIDNSIAAEATEIDIIGDSVEGRFVAFIDNGTGMNPDEARDALKLAGTRHLDRGGRDLGRFGLGLKTASLSQCRRLSVITKHDGQQTGLQWDIDHVLNTGSWSIRVLDDEDMHALPQTPRISDSPQNGTLVLWEELDYLLAGANDIPQWMNEHLDSLRAHLGLVFHRFLEGSGAIMIRVNGIPVSPVDPFLEGHRKTQQAPTEKISFDDSVVAITPYTLPHSSDLSAKERRREDLGTRMRDHQGFYVYRNRRLISHGGWFGLAKSEELSKQSRVRVDVPPGLDQHWQLDIKKSRVEPPQSFRQRLRQIIEQVTGTSTRMHRFRGRSTAQADMTFLWEPLEDRGGFRYAINPKHPMVSALRQALPAESENLLDQTMRDLAACFPAQDLYLRMAEGKPPQRIAHTDADITDRLRALRDTGAYAGDLSALAHALNKVEPFSTVPDLERLLHEVWKEIL